MSDPRRARLRQLAAEHLDAGDPTGWFERLYREAARGEAVVSWDDATPNPHLCRWLDAHPERCRGKALDVGCGFGDNAEELSRRRFDVTAFDVAPSAIEGAAARFPQTRVRYVQTDAFAMPTHWQGAFDFVSEVYTLQVLPPEPRARLGAALGELLRADGTLLVICRAREPNEPEGQLPWPLTRAEIEAIATADLRLESLEEVHDAHGDDPGAPPVRRFVASYRRI